MPSQPVKVSGFRVAALGSTAIFSHDALSRLFLCAESENQPTGAISPGQLLEAEQW